MKSHDVFLIPPFSLSMKREGGERERERERERNRSVYLVGPVHNACLCIFQIFHVNTQERQSTRLAHH